MKSVLLLGLLIGMRHALEADHLAAVASLATRGSNDDRGGQWARNGDRSEHGGDWPVGAVRDVAGLTDNTPGRTVGSGPREDCECALQSPAKSSSSPPSI